MTAVIVAVVAGVAGVLAGLLPSLTVSPRRRMLRLLAEEQALLEKTTDRRTARILRDAHRHSARRYLMWIRVAPHTRSRRVVWQLASPLLVLSLVATIAYTLNETTGQDKLTRYATLTLIYVAPAAIFAMLLIPLVQGANEMASRREEALVLLGAARRKLARRLGELRAQRQEMLETGFDARTMDSLESEIDALERRHDDVLERYGAIKAFDGGRVTWRQVWALFRARGATKRATRQSVPSSR